MVTYLTYSEAKHLVKCMGKSEVPPFSQRYKWFALYGAKRVPADAIHGYYDRDDMGLMGIFARLRPLEPEHELEVIEQPATPQRELVGEPV